MPFEDLLRPPAPKCKTCQFIANLEPGLREEVAAAVGKPIYSDDVLASGMMKVETEYNPAPSATAVRNHRQKGHAA
jgi:hypothetical protein